MDSIEIEKFILRPLSQDDLLGLHSVIGNDPDMTWDFTARPIERTQETLNGRIRHYQDHGFGIWAVTNKDTGELVGEAGLQLLEGTSNVELVVFTAKKYWRHNIGFEASVASLTYGFTEMGLSKILAVTRINNTAAQKLMDKLGFSFLEKGMAYGDPVFQYELSKQDFLGKNSFYKVIYGEQNNPKFNYNKSKTVYY
jgi:ribosomal-protein-alanine N-acetyltransferase